VWLLVTLEYCAGLLAGASASRSSGQMESRLVSDAMRAQDDANQDSWLWLLCRVVGVRTTVGLEVDDEEA